MTTGSTIVQSCTHDVLAPDGSTVRALLSLDRGSMAHFLLPAGQTSRAVRHRTVQEIWYIMSGVGEMWRSALGQQDAVPLSPGTCLTIPLGVTFQFRCIGNEPLTAIAVTMPPWPGEDEAELTDGNWQPIV